jgi:small redox-active disulfide protein 2
MEIKVLGPGCSRCKALEKAVLNACAELDLEADISKEEDIMKIMQYGIMHTPGLIVNDKVVLSGRVPSVNELKEILMKQI